jgi:beta-glucosidase
MESDTYPASARWDTSRPNHTTFEYGALQLESEEVDVRGDLHLSLTITNTGNRRGSEVVQLYAVDTAIGVTRPAQELIGFVRVDLEAGVSETVAFEVPLSVLGYTGLSGEFVLEPGPIEVSAGSSSKDLRSSATFTVTGATRSIERGERAFLSVALVGGTRTLH